MNEKLWHRNDDWIGSEIDDAFVMVNIDTGKYVALNRTANVVWQNLAEPTSQPTIERAMCAAFDVSTDDCHNAVTRLLGQMRDLQLASPV